jgi:hypothetical protein
MNNLSNSEKIQVVINTLKNLEMPPTYDNSSRMVGIYNMLVEVRDAIHAEELEAQKEPAEVKEDDVGETDAE